MVAQDHRDGCTSYRVQTPFPIRGPVHPFITWAVASGCPWQSPVVLAIQVEAGPLVSYRSALDTEGVIYRSRHESPCPSRTQRFMAACPVGAIVADSYDWGACWGDMHAGTEQRCHSADCLVRHASPISSPHPRPARYLVYHMRQFLK